VGGRGIDLLINNLGARSGGVVKANAPAALAPSPTPKRKIVKYGVQYDGNKAILFQ
jgi:hypothetical protein